MNNLIDSVTAKERLGVKGNHLRQLVHKKHLTKYGMIGKRSAFDADEVEALRVSRLRLIPYADE